MKTLILYVVHVYFEFGHLEFWTSDDNSANGALSKLTWSGDQYADESTDYEDTDAPPVTLDTTMTEADFSGKHLGVSGSMVLAAFISSKSFQDKGAMSILDVSNNKIGVEGAKALAPAM